MPAPPGRPGLLLLVLALLFWGSPAAQDAPVGLRTAGNTEVGNTRYPGNGLRYLDGYTGPPVITGVTQMARLPGTNRVLVVASQYGRVRTSWFELGLPGQVPVLVSQGYLEMPVDGSIRRLAIDGSRSCLYAVSRSAPEQIRKYTLSPSTGTAELVGITTMPSGVAALAVREGAGELLAVLFDGSLAKCALGDNSSLPTLIGVSTPNLPLFVSSSARTTTLLVDESSRACFVATERAYCVSDVGAPGSPPIAGSRVLFASGYTCSAGTWVEPGKSALLSTSNGTDRRLVRVDFPQPGGAPVSTTSDPLPPPPASMDELVADPATGLVWQVGRDNTNPLQLLIRRIQPGSGQTPPSVDDQWVNPPGLGLFTSLDLLSRFHVFADLRSGFFLNDNPDGLFGTHGVCTIASVDLDSPSGSNLGYVHTTFGSASATVSAVAHDPASGYSFAVQNESPLRLTKFRSADPGGPISVSGALELPSTIDGYLDLAIDSAAGVGYLLGGGTILKVDLGEGGAPPTLLGELPLTSAQRPTSQPLLLLDPEGRYGFFSAYDRSAFFSSLCKVRLGNSAGPMEVVASTSLTPTFHWGSLLGFDPLHRRLLLANASLSVGFAEAGEGDAPPILGEPVETGTYESFTVGAFASAVLDPVLRTLHLGTNRYQSPPRPYGYGSLYPNSQLVRVGFPGDDPVPSLVSNLPMGASNYGMTSMVASPRDRRGWSALALGNKVVQFDLDDPQTTGTAEILIPGPPIIEPRHAAFDDDSGIAMFSSPKSRTHQLTFFRVATRPDLRGAMRGTRFQLDGTSQVTHAHLWSHADRGRARLAIYSDTDPRVLAWDSGDIAVTADEAALRVPVHPPLKLPAGDYWLCWQIDTAAGVPSHAPGDPGDSFELAQAYGAPPQTFPASAAPPTADRWTAWVSFNGASEIVAWSLYE